MSYKGIIYHFEQQEDGTYKAIEGNPVQKVDEPGITFINDEIPPTEHPCDGKVYTSKHAYDATTKANDCIEVGHRPGDRRSVLFQARRDALQTTINNLKRSYEVLQSKDGRRQIMQEMSKKGLIRYDD